MVSIEREERVFLIEIESKLSENEEFEKDFILDRLFLRKSKN